MIVFDLSRLLSRGGRGTPTGIDRVEFAYAEHLIASGLPLSFAVATYGGTLSIMPRHVAEAFVAATAAIWRGEPTGRRGARWSWLVAQQWLTPPRPFDQRKLRLPSGPDATPPVYLLVSHHHLENRRLIAGLKRRGGTRFVCLIHDLIPIEFPEYVKPGQAERHRRRIDTAAALADAVIVNSNVTRDAFLPHLDRAGRTPPVLVAPFGVDLPAPATHLPPAPARPYFVCVGTIEGRKNHLLLLNLWRDLAERLGADVPQLVLVGRRGWETENVVDMLDRCPALRGVVIEHNSLSDAEMTGVIKGARALLLPSFAEGFGFPVIEALALGVPTLCSDIGALRETGGAVAEYLDPLDGPAWRAAVLDYARPDSPRRAAQLRRLADWHPSTWADHFRAVDALIAGVAAGGDA